MEIHFFERKLTDGQISIEKLFSVLYTQLENQKIKFKVIKNPYPLSEFWKALWFFNKSQGDINHITGDIHWSCLFLDRNKTILTIHDLVGIHQYKGLKKWLYYMFWVYLPIKKLKYITTISEKTKLEIVQLIPSAANKIQVIPNCITTDILPLNFKKKVEKTKILIVGTRSNKNIARVFQACKDLDIIFSIVGKLDEKQQRILNDYHLTYANYVNISDNDLTKLYDENDILCFPSLYEGFGLPILEAQARNCLVITSDLSPMNEVAGSGALFVYPYSIEDIKNSIIKIVSDDDLRKELILTGHENVKKYIPESILQQYIELYQKISAQK